VKRWEQFVSVCAILVICSGVAYSYRREHLSRMDLNPVFQQINREYFNGELSGVRVEWSHLDQDSGQARKFSDGEFLIMVDRRDNTSFAEVRRTVQHESCHVFVDWKEKEEHGAMFQRCMARYRSSF